MMRAAFAIVLAATLSCVAGCGDGNDDDRDAPLATPTAVVTPTATVTPSPTFAAAILVAVYDADVQIDDRAFAGTGAVRVGSAGVTVRVELGNDAALDLSGPLSAEGTFVGSGALRVNDTSFPSTAEAAFTVADGLHVVTGTARAPTASTGGFDRPIAFTLRRSGNADASGFGGTYRVMLAPSPGGCACTTTVDLALTFDATGFGRGSPTTERHPGATAVASLRGVLASVSPAGRLRVGADYKRRESVASERRVILIGELDLAGASVTGAGETFTGFTASDRVGTWTAERID